MIARCILLLALTLLIAACDGGGNYPIHLCKEREVQSGTCTKAEYTCTDPMVLRENPNGNPRCFMPKETQQ